VDDEVTLAMLVKINLEATGDYTVEVQNKGALALETAKAFKPDMIFLDIVMPDMEGSQVAVELKKDPQLSSIPVVFMTATVDAEQVEGSKGMIGGRAFLAKPASIDQIIACIRANTKP
jgi:CheY-like chemotaxis protein